LATVVTIEKKRENDGRCLTEAQEMLKAQDSNHETKHDVITNQVEFMAQVMVLQHHSSTTRATNPADTT
jgi:hypothetical protein